MLKQPLPGDWETVQRFIADLGLYLDEMARHIKKPPQGITRDKTTLLLTTEMRGKRYRLNLACQAWGLRRFVVAMQEPWPHTFVVGRLKGNNRARAYSHGMALLYHYLESEGLIAEVHRDIRECLALSARKQGLAKKTAPSAAKPFHAFLMEQ